MAGPARRSPRCSVCARIRFVFGAAISPAAASRPSRQGGMQGRRRGSPGPPRVKTEAALRVCAPLLEEPVANRANWTIPRLIVEIKKRELVDIGPSQPSKALRKKTYGGGDHGTSRRG